MVRSDSRSRSIARRLPENGGFTYIGVLIGVALMGVALAGTGVVWHTAVKREKERELLLVGEQFRRAIGLYLERTPGPAKRFPQTLEDLLLDRRYPTPQRYLRQIHIDPMTGKAEWGLVKGPGGSIMGVHSLSAEKPLKTAGFLPTQADFTDKEHYTDWKFVYVPAAAAPRPAGASAPGAKPPAGAGAQPDATGSAAQSTRRPVRRRAGPSLAPD